MVILVNENTKKQKQVIRYTLSTCQGYIVSLKKQKTSYIQTAKYFIELEKKNRWKWNRIKHDPDVKQHIYIKGKGEK